MRFKIDTSEKYHVITILEPLFSANMTEEAGKLMLSYLQKPVKNLIINLQDIQNMEDAAAGLLINIQQTFQSRNASFVLCRMAASLQQQLAEQDQLDGLNLVPTESEAWDIVQMEEIERELFGEDEPPT